LSVAPPFSPRLAKAWKAFSRRSRREAKVRKGMTIDRESVTANLPGLSR
jgi:hypothetical protein